MPIAAIVRAVAKSAAKKGAKGAARKAKAGDKAYNARRRYQRSAERYLKKSKETSGETSTRYRFLARKELENAMSTYEQSTTQDFNKTIKGLASELDIDLESERRKFQAMREDTAERMRKSAIDEKRSSSRLVSSQVGDDARREAEAREIINSKVGSRIIGGFVDVWKEAATLESEEGLTVDKSKILPTLYDYFNVDKLSDLIQKVEEIIGDKLYADEDSDMMYEAVKIMLQKHAIQNNTVAA